MVLVKTSNAAEMGRVCECARCEFRCRICIAISRDEIQRSRDFEIKCRSAALETNTHSTSHACTGFFFSFTTLQLPQDTPSIDLNHALKSLPFISVIRFRVSIQRAGPNQHGSVDLTLSSCRSLRAWHSGSESPKRPCHIHRQLDAHHVRFGSSIDADTGIDELANINTSSTITNCRD